MVEYLQAFLKELKRGWQGSLVKVSEAEEIDANAKQYMNRLARLSEIERVAWGWYWVQDKYRDFFDFLRKDKHFKVIQKQTAASYWNGDFIHRDTYSVAVSDKSYGKALNEFAESRGWHVAVEFRKLRKDQYQETGGLYVESLEDTIVDCVKDWAFADALSSLHENKDRVDWPRIFRHSWERISGSDTRVGQVVKYGTGIISRETGGTAYAENRAAIPDDFVRRQVEEAAEKVAEFA